MKNEKIYRSFENISPTQEQKDKMFENIILADKKPSNIKIKRILPISAAAAIIMVTVLVMPDFTSEDSFSSQSNEARTETASAQMEADRVATDSDMIIFNGQGVNEGFAGESIESKTDIATAINYSLNFENRVYGVLAPDTMMQYGLDSSKIHEDIGEYLGTANINAKSVGIYSSNSISNQAVIIAQSDNSAEYYSFHNFSSYENNEDENALEYLKIYGVESADDIAKIEIVNYSDAFSQNSKALSKTEIETFYGFFKELTNSSSEYFYALSNYPSSPPPDNTPIIGEDGSVYTPAYEGNKALHNSVCVIITFDNNITREFWYYPNIQFLSRYKVSDSFSKFIDK